jgi:hypothetical protein
MRRAAVLVALLMAALWGAAARADSGDSAALSARTARIGDHLTLSLHVVTPRGAGVDVLPGSDGWQQIEVINTKSNVAVDQGASTVHALEVVIAPFQSGTVTFTPSVTIVEGGATTVRQLPPVGLVVSSVLAPNDPLELSPLAPPQAISGAQSPFLRPLIALGLLAGVIVLALLAALAAMRLRRALQRPPAESETPPEMPGLGGVEALLATDPVRGYRTLGAAVRNVVGERYGFRAPALTTRELQRRMESAGVERWEARLVGGLLEECDAVVYAGYRPAPERRIADLNMAREIVEPLPAEEVPA